MKIKNFSELDSVLKNSFSSVRKEMREFQTKTTKRVTDTTSKLSVKHDGLDKQLKQLSADVKAEMTKHFAKLADTKDKTRDDFIRSSKKQYEELKAQSTKERALADTKLSTIAKEVKNFKKDIRSIQSTQSQHLQTMKNEVRKSSDTQTQALQRENQQLNNTIETVKKDIVKLMSVLREKLVSRETFDKRNEAYEKFLKDVLEQTKDLDKVKLSYFARNSVNSQLETFEEKFTGLQGETKKLQDLLEQLKTAQNSLVQQTTHESTLSQVKDLQRDQQQLQSSLSALQADASRKSDTEQLNQQLSALKSEHLNTDSRVKQDHSQLNEKVSEIQTWQKTIEALERKLDKQEALSQQNKAKIDLIQDMNLTSPTRQPIMDQHVEVEQSQVIVQQPYQPPEAKVDVVKDVEQMLTDRATTEEYSPPTLEQPTGPGVLSKVKDGIVNFFFEEVEDDVSVEVPPTVTVPEGKKKPEPIAQKPEIAQPKSDKQSGYMQSRSPKIFEDIEADQPGSRKKRYKRVDGDEITAESTDEIYYPEDYFY